MDKLACVLSLDNINNNPLESLDAIKKAGFKNVFLQWYDNELEVSQFEQLEYARKLGLNVIFCHLGYQGMNNLWLDNEEGEALKKRYLDDLKVLHELNIDFAVLHLCSKTVAPPYNEIGLRRVKEVCDLARSLGIKVAFENTKIQGYVDYILENIDYENVGFCFDVGHYHCHFNDEFNFDLVKNRVLAIHLHDNNGDKDSHFLPFDGTVNWLDTVNKLKYVNYNGYVTEEVVYSERYKDISIDDFYKKAYEVGSKLEKMIYGK